MSAKPRILVIDDEQQYHDRVRNLLPADRFEVSSSMNRREALDQIERRRSEESRVGKECRNGCRSRRAP
jgi:DNA-binding NtrC family response regulator